VEGSFILPYRSSEFTHSDVLRLHSPSARASAMDAFVNCDKTFIRGSRVPPYAEALLGRLPDLGPDNLHCSSSRRARWLPYSSCRLTAKGLEKHSRGAELWRSWLSFVSSRARGSLLRPRIAGSPFTLRLGAPKRNVVCSVSH